MVEDVMMMTRLVEVDDVVDCLMIHRVGGVQQTRNAGL
jgi:hypothetical protein